MTSIIPALYSIFPSLCLSIALFDVGKSAPGGNSWIASGQKAGSEKPYIVCETESCQRLSKLLRSQIDASTDPCSDFYRHACGEFVARHTPKNCNEMMKSFREEANPPDGSEIRRQMARETIINATITRLFAENTDGLIPETENTKRMKQFYQSCLDWSSRDSRISDAQIMSYIRNFAHWPLFNRAGWHDDYYDVNDIMARLAGYSIGSLFEVAIAQSVKDATKMSLHLLPPKTITPVGKQSETQSSQHREMIAQLFVELGESVGINATDTANREWLRQEVIIPVIAFEENLAARIEPTPGDALAKESFFLNHSKQLSFRELNLLFAGTGFAWEHFFGVVFRKSVGIGQKGWREFFESRKMGSLKVTVLQLPYFEHLARALTRTPQQTVANYLLLRLALGVSSALGGVGDDAAQMPEDLKIEKSTKATSVVRSCFGQLEKYFDVPLSAFYGAARFPSSKTLAVKKLFDKVYQAARETVDKNTWMSAREKAAFFNKMVEMNRVKSVGNIQGGKQLNLRSLTKWRAMQPNYSFLDNVMIGMEMNLNPLFAPKDRRDYANKYPTTVMSAAYLYQWNGLVVPAGNFEYPFYDEQWPMSYNLGLSGFVMGHEVFHGFDNYGIRFGAEGDRLVDPGNGNPKTIIDDNYEVLQKSMNCMEKTFNNYCYDIPPLGEQCVEILSTLKTPVSEAIIKTVKERRPVCINGSSTLGENMADYNGIRAAWRAHKNAQTENPQDVRLPGLEDYSMDQLFFLGSSFFFLRTAESPAAPESTV